MNEQDYYVKQCNHYCRKDNKKAALSITDKAAWYNYFQYSRIYLLLNASNNPFLYILTSFFKYSCICFNHKFEPSFFRKIISTIYLSLTEIDIVLSIKVFVQIEI